ncbi:TPA: hypothetical protein ACJ6XF_003053 [Legionella pneumophila]
MDENRKGYLQFLQDKNSLSSDPSEIEEKWDEHKQRLKHEREKHQQEIDNEAQNIALRRAFSGKVFGLTVATLIVIMYLIIFSGIAHLFNNTFLSDRILGFLIGFAGVDMLGLFAIILTYLFNKKH